MRKQGDKATREQGNEATSPPLTHYLSTRYLLAALLILGAIYYLDRIAQWFAYDDEGGYLYAAWRIGAGELPYRDFLTPKLPAFLYPGALILKLTDNSVFAIRVFSTLFTLGAVALLYLTLRRLWGDRVALLAMIPALLQRDFFWAARFFRPEAPMLFWDALGLYLFVVAHHGTTAEGATARDRPYMAVSGVAFALATLSNLFGLLPLVGCLLFLAVQAWRERAWDQGVRSGLWMGVPYALVGGLTVGLFILLAPNFLSAVLGHHLRQGRELTPWQVALKGLRLYWDVCRVQPVLMLLALIGGIRSLRSRHRLASIFVWQLPTALSFLFISRGLQARHLVYLVPSLSALAAIGLAPLWESRRLSWGALAWRGGLILLLLAAALYPSWRDNRRVAGLWERDTQRLADYIRAHTDPDDYVLSDYPGLNFFARRMTTPLAAGISRGAAKSGQITGSDLIREIEAYDVRMVILNVAQGAHQLVNLRDYPAFKRYLQTHFHLAGRAIRDYRLLEIYHRRDLWPGEIVGVNFGDQLRLSGFQWTDAEAPPGKELRVKMRWQSTQDMGADYLVTLILRDEEGHQWGLGSKRLTDVDAQTYWDEEGLERAVLIPTSKWPVAETTVGAFELPVDLATPPGEYTVLVRVHPPAVWEGLPVRSSGGAASGFDYPLGKVWVLPASEPPSIETLQIAQPRRADFGREIRLLGWDVSTTDVRPGDEVHLSLYWRAQRSLPTDYIARLWLIDEQGHFGGEVRAEPAGQHTTSQWRAGEILRGQYDLTVDAAAPAGNYSLMLNLFDKSGDPLRASDVKLGAITVSGRQRLFEPPAEIQHEVKAELGGLVRFLGYDLPRTEVSPGEVLSLTLYWQALQRMDTSYTVFTHLLDENYRIWGQRDNIPVQGTYPTTGWLEGEVIVDEYQIPVREDASPGCYRIEIGLYDAATGIRLPVVDPADRALLGDHLLLEEEITVREVR
ncbi:MAG: phospholipid carrier-dependent glycosyltransferase [Chloroflexota bacterium]|nr:phospholipid carrier-dependent glycosyltransferase [Chloroflexota bacterium]